MKKYFSSSRLSKRFVRLSSILFTVSAFSYSNVAFADVEGIPSNPDFPNAQYPYAQVPDGCSGWQSTREVRDTWGPVSFTGACDNHDRCYYTRGSNWNTCNERFYADLRASCERDLRTSTQVPAPTLSDPFRTRRVDLPPDPVRLSACYTLASGYYAGVQAGVLLDVFNEAQNKQRRYEDWVASVRNPSLARSPVFDASFYLTSYGDLRSAFGSNQESAKNHWLRNGIREGRRSSPAFDVQYYLGIYPDLQNAFGANNYAAAVNHWLSNGIREGRKSSLVFDVQYYLGRYPDLQNAFGRNNYAAAINHWLSNGIREGRQGSANFDPRYYLSNNLDVARAFGANNYQGAITHYLTNGRREGRRGTP